jgi:hypothetical protein
MTRLSNPSNPKLANSFVTEMKNQTKTDNHSPDAKLNLRRHFLRKLRDAKEPIRVLDCFQGSKLLWGQLESEFQIASYWGVDLKEKKGRIKIDSSRILEQEGWNQNVIDLDAYGSPWKHWRNLITTCRHSVTIFLTIGTVRRFDKAALHLAGVDFRKMKIPNSLGMKIQERALGYAIAAAELFKLFPVEVLECVPQDGPRCLGITLEYRPNENKNDAENTIAAGVSSQEQK